MIPGNGCNKTGKRENLNKMKRTKEQRIIVNETSKRLEEMKLCLFSDEKKNGNS